MKKINVLVFISVMFIFSGCSRMEQTQPFIYTFDWEGTICSGTYTGEIWNGQPEGTGEFHGYIIYNGEKKDEVTYTGEWSEGRLNGTGIFTNITEGVSYEGIYEKNKKTGSFLVRNTNERTYEEVNYDADFPYGMSALYSEENNGLIGYERYYNGQKVSEIMEGAAVIAYEELIYNTDAYIYDSVCVEGEIIAKTMQYRAGNTILSRKDGYFVELTVVDEEDNKYMLYYNADYQDVAECYIGELELGENVTFYGYMKGLIAWNSVLPDCPLIQVICAQTEEDADMVIEELDFEYDNFIRYPYEFSDKSIEITGLVKEVGNYDNNRIFLLIESKDFLDKGKNNYFCYIEKNREEYEERPLIGDTVTITGELKQIYYRLLSEGIAVYPRVSISSIVNDAEDSVIDN